MDRVFPKTLNHLLWIRFKGKLQRWLGGFHSPRRRLVASIGTLLGLIWISQAVISILFRNAAEHDSMVQWSSIALTLYLFWQVLKTVMRKPFEPHEWADAEKELLHAAPIHRSQLVTYRLTGIAVGSFVKALFLSIILLPDLPFWPAGFLGLFFVLFFVELFRVCFELLFTGLSLSLRWVCRGSVFIILLAPLLIIWLRTLTVMNAPSTQDLPMSILIFRSVLMELNSIVSSWLGVLVLSVMAIFSEAIFIDSVSLSGFGDFIKIFLATCACLALVYRLDAWFVARCKIKEGLGVSQVVLESTSKLFHSTASRMSVRVPLRMKGMGAVAWRQLVSAYHYRMILSISLGIPAILCLCPLLIDANSEATLVGVVGGLLFYSFLLLPSALVLDFRRDLDRMDVLKSLPVATIWLAIGQLTAPVVLATGFQAGVLFVATIFSSIIWSQAVFAGLILVGFNLLIFTAENLIFLLSPYRRNQEGLDVFIRTVLTFTGKGIVFGLAVSVLLVWATLSVLIVGKLGLTAGWAIALFCIGLFLMIGGVEILLLFGLVRLFNRFDPSADCPAAS